MRVHQPTEDMLSVEEAQEKILALVPVLEAEERPLLEALRLQPPLPRPQCRPPCHLRPTPHRPVRQEPQEPFLPQD